MLLSESKTPLAVRLELTHRCNLKCIHCLNEAGTVTPQNELSTAEWLAVFRRLKELNVIDVLLSGGEVFLRSDIFELLEWFGPAPRFCQLRIFTNGTLLDGLAAARLRALGLRFISISVDGTREVHDRIRSAGAFDRTMAGISHLLEVGIRPSVNITPMRLNAAAIGPTIEFLADLGIGNITVSNLKPEGRCGPVARQLALRFPDEVRDVVETVAREQAMHPSLSIRCTCWGYLALPRMYEEYIAAHPDGARPTKYLKEACSAAGRSCHITADGTMVPCWGLWDFAGGNVRERDILDIWQTSENFRRIRELARVRVSETEYCGPCPYNFLCDGGCRAVAYRTCGDLLAPAWCPYWEARSNRVFGAEHDVPGNRSLSVLG